MYCNMVDNRVDYPHPFEWDNAKNRENVEKHGVSFQSARIAFFDSRRIILLDRKHSSPEERRYFCFGRVGMRILTVRFTYRSGTIRIFGAGYWREGRRIYEKKNRLF